MQQKYSLDTSNLLYTIAGRPAWVEVKMANRPKIPHTWVIHTYTKPTKCHFCNKVDIFTPHIITPSFREKVTESSF